MTSFEQQMQKNNNNKNLILTVLDNIYIMQF